MMSGVSLLWRHAVFRLLSFISLFYKVNRSGADAQVTFCQPSFLAVTFHPIVEQLTIFYISELDL